MHEQYSILSCYVNPQIPFHETEPNCSQISYVFVYTMVHKWVSPLLVYFLMFFPRIFDCWVNCQWCHHIELPLNSKSYSFFVFYVMWKNVDLQCEELFQDNSGGYQCNYFNYYRTSDWQCGLCCWSELFYGMESKISHGGELLNACQGSSIQKHFPKNKKEYLANLLIQIHYQ